MTKFSEAQVRELMGSPVWKELTGRIQKMYDSNEDLHMENSDPFFHGMGVGSRKVMRSILRLPALLLEEAQGKPVVRSIKGNGGILEFRK